MQPYDGYGYGKSTYWSWKSMSVAERNGEYCSCWHKNTPDVEIFPQDGLTIRIKCVMKDALCRKNFPMTENEIKRQFEQFYKV